MSALECVDFCVAMLLDFYGLTDPRTRPPSAQAQQKALALLRLWLSPEQAAQYNSKKHFDVIGSDTGTRYRIRHGTNIDQLDSSGDVCAWSS
jgi:hypothetical protein